MQLDLNTERRRELWAGLRLGAVIGGVALAVLIPWMHASRAHAPQALAASPVAAQRAPIQTPPSPALARQLDMGSTLAPPDVRQVAEWAVNSGDPGERPFAIVDKRRAQLYVFEPTGRLRGATPVLLGYAAGDLSAPGIGLRPLDQIKPSERTTPAGRFESHPGRNTQGEDVVWVDYDAAVSMHRVRATNPKERRLERLATPTPSDNRISWGCINVPTAFYDQNVLPALGTGRGTVYVLPEQQPLSAHFPAAVRGAALPHPGKT